jgi:ribosomal protein S12 methylthiotransferase accessory factor
VAPLRGSLREREPSRTWALARRLMPALGISRVTDITRLDRLGWPVFASVRPRGRVLAVHAGKGLCPVAARIGALMEALELAVAETDAARGPDTWLDWPALQRHWPLALEPAHFAPQLGADVQPGQHWPCLRADWIDTDSARVRRAPVPAALLRLPAAGDAAVGPFPWSSNGLASGNSLTEATLHALLELLERDTLALHAAVDRSSRLHGLPPPVAHAARAWALEGVELLVRALPNEFGLACVSALLVDHRGGAVNLARGSGLHPDRGIALLRAVSEAAQSRLSTVHGGRDDVVGFYDKYQRMSWSARRRREAAVADDWRCSGPAVAFEALPHRSHRSVAQALREVRRRLARAGFPAILRHVMPWPPAVHRPPPLAVVKLVVPGLEMLEPHNRRIGPRLRARLAERARLD